MSIQKATPLLLLAVMITVGYAVPVKFNTPPANPTAATTTATTTTTAAAAPTARTEFLQLKVKAKRVILIYQVISGMERYTVRHNS